MKRIYLLFLVCVLAFSCKSRKSIVSQKDHPEKPVVVISSEDTSDKSHTSETPEITPKVYASATEKYIDVYKAIAQSEMALYGIPASITLAQGILESGSGNGRLSVEANNHFGIKCHGWTGKKIYHDDDERQECFRKYKDPKYSFRDHSLFLSERKRYAGLFKLKKGDYKGWARGLKDAGYATDRKYPQKLISLIERYQLYEFDKEVLGQDYDRHVEIAEIDETVYTVSKGDTLYSIAKKYNTTVENIQRVNDLAGTTINIGQELIIKP
ncbi:glucosaminidase domain-containing protein [Gaetbulibacter sp. M240]|uniref:glucosaminidase domain-containing protein n=1 Tax=Gaetbulibacter sp. M240 TaxID=3126511 RepID=UPI00374E2841